MASAGGGFTLASAALGCLALLASRGLAAYALPALFLAGVGLGPAVSTCLVGPQSRAPRAARGMVTSGIYATRALGGALAVAVLGEGSGLFVGGPARLAALALVALVTALVVLALGRPPQTAK